MYDVGKETLGVSCNRDNRKSPFFFFNFNMSCDIGVYGLGVMGTNLALNIASKGFNVAASNRSLEKVEMNFLFDI